MMSRIYKITGMDCPDEIEKLKIALGSIPDVTNLNFNLLNSTMTITTLSGDDATVIKAVSATGMKAVRVAADNAMLDDHEARLSDRGDQWRVWLCRASALLLMAGFISHAILHGGFYHALAVGHSGGEHGFPLIAVVFYSLAVMTGSWFIVPKAINAARHLRPDINLLMTIAVLGAIMIGEWLEAATITFLFALSLLLESRSVSRARRAIRALLDISPQTARCLCTATGEIKEVPVTTIALGDTVIVRPGERIPLDGIVCKGLTSVNQAPITGESMPVHKHAGDEVFAGTINQTGVIEFNTTRVFEDTTLARIIRMVEEAQSRRAVYEQWVTKFARYYTPIMVALAVCMAVFPPLLRGGDWSTWLYQALVMLVIACPCALVISTPVSIVAALTTAAHTGILIKGGAFLEAAAQVRVVAFDKTGTVTVGSPTVQQLVPMNGHTAPELLQLAAALEAHSSHPIAKAILQCAEATMVIPVEAEAFTEVSGKGVLATVAGQRFWLGSYRFADEQGMASSLLREKAETLEDAGHSVVIIGNNNHACGLISVADGIREDAKNAVSYIKQGGIKNVVMLTGDNTRTARQVAAAVDMDEVYAELLPEDKMLIIKELIARHGPTAMVGDGINDAPALAAATLGIAVGGAGADVAIETADIALMSDNLLKLPWLFRHARRTVRIIKQNIFFALAIKSVFMILALANVATLWMAIVADTGASLAVIFNSLRLLNMKNDGNDLNQDYSQTSTRKSEACSRSTG